MNSTHSTVSVLFRPARRAAYYPPDRYFATVDGHFASGTMPTAPGTHGLSYALATSW